MKTIDIFIENRINYPVFAYLYDHGNSTRIGRTLIKLFPRVWKEVQCSWYEQEHDI